MLQPVWFCLSSIFHFSVTLYKGEVTKHRFTKPFRCCLQLLKIFVEGQFSHPIPVMKPFNWISMLSKMVMMVGV